MMILDDHLPPPAESPALPPEPDMDSRRPTATSSRCTKLANSAIPGRQGESRGGGNNGDEKHELEGLLVPGYIILPCCCCNGSTVTCNSTSREFFISKALNWCNWLHTKTMTQ